MTMFVLPALAWLSTYLVLLGRGSEISGKDPRGPFIEALCIWGVVLVGAVEILSLAQAITQASLGAVWLCMIVVVLAAGWRSGSLRRGQQRLIAALRGFGALETGFLVSLVVIFGLLFVIAVVAPPNNNDSLSVHLVRVVRWAQDGSVAAPSTRQFTGPPFAEMAMLNLRVLAGGDRPVALVQWFALICCTVIGSGIAARLGASRAGQMVAAGFVVSVPLAVLTSTNTKNDLVVSVWVLALAYLAVVSSRRGLTTSEILQAGAVVGLGFLTKATFPPAAFPLVIWLAINVLRPRGWAHNIVALGLIGLLALAVNMGHWLRNFRTFGTPFGTVGMLTEALEVDDLISGPGTDAAVGPPAGDAGPSQTTWPFVSRAASLLALHTIFPEVGAPIRSALARLPGVFEPGYLASLEEGLWNHEDSAGNLIHVLLAMVASLWTVLRSWRRREWVSALFVLAVWLGWASLTLVTQSLDRWAGRYQLAFLLLSGSIVGLAASWLRRAFAAPTLAFLLLLTMPPYLLLNNSRPLVGARPRTRSESILTMPAADVLFVGNPGIQEPYSRAADLLRQSTCRDVGLILGFYDYEYTLWWLLQAPQSEFHLESVARTPDGAVRATPPFAPCAILCTECGDVPSLLGYRLQYDGSVLRMYTAEP